MVTDQQVRRVMKEILAGKEFARRLATANLVPYQEFFLISRAANPKGSLDKLMGLWLEVAIRSRYPNSAAGITN